MKQHNQYNTKQKAQIAGNSTQNVLPPQSEFVGQQTSHIGVFLFSVMMFVFGAALAAVLCYLAGMRIGLFSVCICFVCGIACAMSIHIAQEWEHVIVLRLGKFHRSAGPGCFLTIPFIDSNVIRVDTRLRVTTFDAKRTLSSDLVPLDVDAVLFWVVWDARAASVEVTDFACAVQLAAQTALRDAIGRSSVAEVALKREQLDSELKKMLEDEVSAWGVSIISVQVRDILIPEDLQQALSLEAQAEQRRKARMILMEGEKDLALMLKEAAGEYKNDPEALRLRTMHLLYESMRDAKSSLVIPSALSDGFEQDDSSLLKALVGSFSRKIKHPNE